MNAIIQTLEDHLRTSRSEFYKHLNTPLSDARVTQLEARYSLNLPADVAALYSWKDGQEDDCYEAFVNNSTFLPLAQALETAAELTAMIGTDFEIENWWNAAWIPLFTMGAATTSATMLPAFLRDSRGRSFNSSTMMETGM